MNVYDFDKTLYPKDSTLEFYLISLAKHPSFLLDLPRALTVSLLRLFGRRTKKELREGFFASFARLADPEGEAERFWEKREGRLFPYYAERRRPDDVVISASPEFLLRPIARRAGFGTLIASRLDPVTGKYEGERCYGEEKPPRFFEVFPEGEVDEFYSDSLSDAPMAALAKRAYLVKGGELLPWPSENP